MSSDRTIPFPVGGPVENKIDYFSSAIYQRFKDHPKLKIIGVSGTPATGKSLLAKKLECLYPNSFLYDLEALSKNCDYYTPDNGWSVGKLIGHQVGPKKMIIIDGFQLAGYKFPQRFLSNFIADGGRVLALCQDIVNINIADQFGEPIKPDWFVLSRDDIRLASTSDIEFSPEYQHVVVN